MFDSPLTQQRIGRTAWATAWGALLLGQLHAMARHQTADGAGDLRSGLAHVWSDPGRRAFRPLLDWAGPDTVYLTYGKLWLPVFLAFTLAAYVVRRRRQPRGFEAWAWRIALVGYVGACASDVAEYWTQWGAMNDGLLDVVFLLTLPFMLLTMVGSTLLGIALLRAGLRLPAILLLLAVPGLVLIPVVTSLGNVVLPVAFAFGILGRRVARERLEVTGSAREAVAA